MALSASRTNVGTSATKIVSKTSSIDAKQSALVRNAGAASVYLGGSTVTTATGWELAAGGAVQLDVDTNDELYAIAASGTVRCDVLVQS